MGGSSAAERRRGLGDAAGTPIRRALRPVVAVGTSRGPGACCLERRALHCPVRPAPGTLAAFLRPHPRVHVTAFVTSGRRFL